MKEIGRKSSSAIGQFEQKEIKCAVANRSDIKAVCVTEIGVG